MTPFEQGFEKRALPTGQAIIAGVANAGRRVAGAGAKLMGAGVKNPALARVANVAGRGVQAAGNAVAAHPLRTTVGAVGAGSFLAGRMTKGDRNAQY